MALAAATWPLARDHVHSFCEVIDRYGALRLPVSWPFSFLRSRFSKNLCGTAQAR
jgi:hypothetical protein